MHIQAYDFVRKIVESLPRRESVLEFGSRNVNGSTKDLFGSARYTGVDSREGPNVDIVADASAWESKDSYDTVVCTETMEHAPDPEGICRAALKALKIGGVFIVTVATPPRQPHSAIDGGEVRDGEYYSNIRQAELAEWLKPFGFYMIAPDSQPGDLYAIAVKTQ